MTLWRKEEREKLKVMLIEHLLPPGVSGDVSTLSSSYTLRSPGPSAGRKGPWFRTVRERRREMVVEGGLGWDLKFLREG